MGFAGTNGKKKNEDEISGYLHIQHLALYHSAHFRN
jgi:hypothetical protein